ncbi:nitroreductase/quinone reductase family protein [Pseudonocardia sp. KRD291]|uniref:nitroreductase/quinone reductase family protein n=1 Tax=Pseudonocardia sp. KRD291 TaxID=2792007 RepID=UPI001C4A1F0E|nr:nitroreductase/quinone reductase family protein [Pseudonocardia sp. KRD291]MBW0104952.1 nitroreductase family deazaflavin-dependent oxidoreductase [Pseudonocardia sp. KRD291]
MATDRSARTSATPPRWLKPLNRVLMTLQRLGLGMRELPVLTVAGRRSGRPRRTPVSVLHLDGQRYLLVGYPGADWGRNARAAGRGTLTVGRVVEPVRLVELDPQASLPVLREWPVQLASGAAMMRDAGVVEDVTPEAFEKIAGVCPVFRVETER